MLNVIKPPRHIGASMLFAAALALLAMLPPARAQTDDGIVSMQGDPAAREETRERLFRALKAAPNKLVAQQITALIWHFWFEAPDTDSAQLMSDALKRRQSRDFAGAISVLDQLVAQAPDWAEAWNQRATLRFLVGDFQGSLADIDQVLPLEPKHFGALSGEAMILRRLGEQDKAQSVLKRAVKINPFLNDRVLLKPEPEGEDI